MPAINDDKVNFALETWKTAIDVQKHFNTLEMQIRNIAITVLTATIGAGGLLFGQTQETIREAVKAKQPVPPLTTVHLFGVGFSTADMLIMAGLIAWLAFYFMDRWWYHRLLQGAVKQAQTIEDMLKTEVEYGHIMSLSNSIRAESHIKLFKKIQVGSNTKIDLFYGTVMVVLVLIIAFAF